VFWLLGVLCYLAQRC